MLSLLKQFQKTNAQCLRALQSLEPISSETACFPPVFRSNLVPPMLLTRLKHHTSGVAVFFDYFSVPYFRCHIIIMLAIFSFRSQPISDSMGIALGSGHVQNTCSGWSPCLKPQGIGIHNGSLLLSISVHLCSAWFLFCGLTVLDGV